MKRKERLALINARNALINSHKTPPNNQWRMIGGKKRSRNSSYLITIRKQPKTDDSWQEKPLLTYNTFEQLEEMQTIVLYEMLSSLQSSSKKIRDPPSLRQLLNQITNGEFDLKSINVDNYRIQNKSSIANINIVKEFKTRNTEFHTYKSKQERSFKIV